MVPIFYLLSSIFLAAGLCGCGSTRALRGGHAATTGALTQKLVQSENPSAPSRQSQETIKVRTYTLPAASPTSDFRLQTSDSPCPPSPLSILPSSVLVTEREESRATTDLGAAQKDTAREIGAKLSSLKGIVWVGLALFIFGLASFAWPPLRAIIGSVTTSAAITLGGIALMILPTLIVGHELLILAGVAVLVGGWFLAHRHGHLRGLLSASSSFSPAPPKLSEGGSSIPTPNAGSGGLVASKPGEDGSTAPKH